MIHLKDYSDYWERMARRVDGVTSAMPVTVDDNMAKAIQSLKPGTVTLFYLPPGAESAADNPDAFAEKNTCVIFIMEKYDTQRRSAFDALATSQPAIEAVKAAMLADMAAGCPVMRFDPRSLSTLPETKFYSGFAGWSLGFTIITR